MTKELQYDRFRPQNFSQCTQNVQISPINGTDGVDGSGLPGRDEAGEDAEDDGYEHAGEGVVGGKGDGEVFGDGIDRNGNEED